MDEEEKAQLRELLNEHKLRMHELDLIKAQKGVETEASVNVERRKIAKEMQRQHRSPVIRA